jgi:hypothetical protein
MRMAALTDVLNRNRMRISEARFAQLVEQALGEIGGPITVDPATALTAAEVSALQAVKADLSPLGKREADPHAPAAAAYAVLLADALSVSDVAARLGIDASRVRHRLAKRQLLGIRRPRGWLLPAYQFGADGRLLPGVERVTASLATAHPVVVARFFATPQPELVVERRVLTPRAWLEGGGDPARVVALARALDLVA